LQELKTRYNQPSVAKRVMDLLLQDKVALVTGGSRGIGRSIALRLAAEGCRVAICGRTLATLEQTQQELAALAEARFTVADVTQPQQIEQFVAETVSKWGRIDLVVANAGGSVGGNLLDSTAADWQQTFNLNLFHAVHLIRAAVPHMQAGGSVVIISSISGWKPTRSGAQYATAKAAEIHLAGVLAQELASRQIRVNTLSPGSILFPEGGWERYQTNHPDKFAKFEQEEFPWQRLGRPEEVADVAAFLLSERARWINGANIPVDGAQGRPSVS
jgi:3-oxoacyl-[acyl-carrier protein] reductase